MLEKESAKYQKNSILAIGWICVCILERLLPHPANFTPLTNLCIFAGNKLSKRLAFGVMFITLVISDIVLAYWQGHPIFSSWSIFTYSGFAAMIFLGTRLSQKKMPNMLGYVLGSTLGFWLWTNFGTWLCSSMYALTLAGLEQCYLTALPFLRNAIFGDLLWFGVIFLGFKMFTSARVAKWQTRWI